MFSNGVLSSCHLVLDCAAQTGEFLFVREMLRLWCSGNQLGWSLGMRGHPCGSQPLDKLDSCDRGYQSLHIHCFLISNDHLRIRGSVPSATSLEWVALTRRSCLISPCHCAPSSGHFCSRQTYHHNHPSQANNQSPTVAFSTTHLCVTRSFQFLDHESNFAKPEKLSQAAPCPVTP